MNNSQTITNPTNYVQAEGTIEDLKKALDITSLPLSKSLKDGEYTGWLKYFNNSRRLQVSMHEDTMKHIQANPTLANLGLQYELREGAKGEYQSYRVVAYSQEDIIATL